MCKPSWLVGIVLAAMAIWLAFAPAEGEDRLSRDLQRTLEQGRKDLLSREQEPASLPAATAIPPGGRTTFQVVLQRRPPTI